MFGSTLQKSQRRSCSPFTVEMLESRRVLAGPGDGELQLSRFESDAELEEFLLNDALEMWDGLFGQPGWPGPWPVPLVDAPPFIRDLAGGGVEHSDTNVQEAGVDEADIVENDGNYLYILSGSELVIADAWTPDELDVTARIEVEGQPIGEYLDGDRLTVISSTFDNSWIDDPWLVEPAIRPAVDLAYPFALTPPHVQVTVFDVAERHNPVVVQRSELDGSYIDSRVVAGKVYVITSDSFGLPVPDVHCMSSSETENGDNDGQVEPGPTDAIWFPTDQTCVYETREEYTTRLEGRVLELGLPHYSTYDATNTIVQTGRLSEATDIYRPVSPIHSNLLSISVFDMLGDDIGPGSSISVPTTYSSAVYASTDSLYLTNPDWGVGRGLSEATSILKFDIARRRSFC